MINSDESRPSPDKIQKQIEERISQVSEELDIDPVELEEILYSGVFELSEVWQNTPMDGDATHQISEIVHLILDRENGNW